MAGIKPLRRIQFGAEGTKGTAVAATTYWRGEGVLVDNREVIHIAESVGNIMGLDRTCTPKFAAAISFDAVEATFEQLPYIFGSGIKDVTGVQDGTGSDYIYTYPFPTTTKQDIKTHTIEGGDDEQAEEMAYCFVEQITLSGAAGEPVKVQSNWVGRTVEPTTFTGALSVPTVEEILFGLAKLYIDNTDTYPATTQITQSFLSFEFTYKTGWQAVYTGDGNLYFTFAKLTRPEATLKITFEHDSQSVAEKAAWREENARAVRILIEGSALTTAGTTYSKKTLILDAVGKYTEFTGLEDQDDNDTVTGTLTVRYNGTAASAGQFIVVNEEVAGSLTEF